MKKKQVWVLALRGSEVFTMLLAPSSLRQYHKGVHWEEKHWMCYPKQVSQPHTKSTETCLAVSVWYHD